MLISEYLALRNKISVTTGNGVSPENSPRVQETDELCGGSEKQNRGKTRR